MADAVEIMYDISKKKAKKKKVGAEMVQRIIKMCVGRWMGEFERA